MYTLEVKNLKKSFHTVTGDSPVLKGVDFSIDEGDFAIIFGPSGCGKSTLLNTMLGLEPPDSGRVLVKGADIYEKNEDERAIFRREKFGVVYQQPNWIKSMNVLENVALPLNISGMGTSDAFKKAREILYLFKFDNVENYYPMELSVGQQQKLSVCRALVSDPWIVLADEPTGNLDTVSGSDLMYIFKVLNDESKRTILMVTHNPDYEKYASKVIYMQDGTIKRVDKKRVSKRSSVLMNAEEKNRVPLPGGKNKTKKSPARKRSLSAASEKGQARLRQKATDGQGNKKAKTKREKVGAKR